ncbi:MAG TPA: tetratricopeptide repeat protein [Verrucomicrobiae bacterium]|jgi:tetratricopeptide (TPR) repeat protein
MSTASNIIDFDPSAEPTFLACEPQPKSEGSVHPHVLLVHWEIYFRAGNWQAACQIAESLIVHLPDEAIGWIYRSFALRQMKRTAEAKDELLVAARKFSKDWRIAYNLACYQAELGDIPGAWNWLDRAIEIGDVELIKTEALAEPALERLWAKL